MWPSHAHFHRDMCMKSIPSLNPEKNQMKVKEKICESRTDCVLGPAGLSGRSGRFGGRDAGRFRELLLFGGKGFFGGKTGSTGFWISTNLISSPRHHHHHHYPHHYPHHPPSPHHHSPSHHHQKSHRFCLWKHSNGQKSVWIYFIQQARLSHSSELGPVSRSLALLFTDAHTHVL